MKKFQFSLLVFALSVIVTAAFWAILPQGWRSNENDDYFAFYEPEARQLLAGQGFTRPGGQIATRYPPGYALILAGVLGPAQRLKMPDTLALSVFILFCTGLSSTFVFLLACEAFDLQSGVISGLLWMTYPFNLWLTKQPNSEIPFMVLFFGCVFLFWRLVHSTSSGGFAYLALGLLTGLAALIRPAALGLALLFAVFILVQSPLRWPTRVWHATLLLLAFLLTILPWVSYVYLKTGELLPLSTGGVYSAWDGLTYAVAGGTDHPVPDQARNLMAMIQGRAEEVFSSNKNGLLTVVIQEAAHNPAGGLQLLGLKMARSWYGTESGRLEAASLGVQVLYLAAVLWGGLTVWRSEQTHRQYLVFAVAIGGYFWLATVAVLSILRYMTPVMGVLIPLIPAGITRFPKIKSALNQWLPIQ